MGTFRPFFPYGNLNPLCGEALAEWGALTDAGEFLGRVNLENVAEDRCQHRCLSLVDRRLAV